MSAVLSGSMRLVRVSMILMVFNATFNLPVIRRFCTVSENAYFRVARLECRISEIPSEIK